MAQEHITGDGAVEFFKKIMSYDSVNTFRDNDKLVVLFSKAEDISEKHGNSYKVRNTIREYKKQGYTPLYFFDTDIKANEDVVKDMITRRLWVERIKADDCVVKKVNHTQAERFYAENSIKPYTRFKMAYGLYYNDELVMCIAFDKTRFNKKYEWEIIRNYYKKGVSVEGGFSKIFDRFVSDVKPKSLIAYTDMRFDEDSVYDNTEMSFSHCSDPNYFYIKNGNVFTRYEFQKRKLAYLLPEHYSVDLTEREILARAGYYRVYDAGCNVYTWEGK